MSDLCPVYAPFFGAMVSFTADSYEMPRYDLFAVYTRVVPVPSCLRVCLFSLSCITVSHQLILQVLEQGKFSLLKPRASSRPLQLPL